MKVSLSQMSLRACETLNHSRSLFLYPPSFSRTLSARVATIATIARLRRALAALRLAARGSIERSS